MVKCSLLATLLCSALLSCAPKQKLEQTGPVRLIAGGDIEWSQRVRLPDYYVGIEDKSKKITQDGWRRLSYVANSEAQQFLDKELIRRVAPGDAHYKTAKQFSFEFANERERLAHPFVKIKKTLSEADITFVNLEVPLSDKGRLSGAFRMPESFAKHLAESGIDIVSTANNHAFDAEGEGITDTLRALKLAGIVSVGTGENLDAAVRAKIIKRKGQTFAFLAFTYGVNPTITNIGLATDERSGAAPLDPFIIKKAINNVKSEVDYVIVSLHWGLENKTDVHKDARKLAYEIIDSGADIILGHHPHVPRGVEVYKDGLIAYSMGNFIFGHNHDIWGDNFLLELVLGEEQILSANLIPIAGAGKDITQPFVLKGERAITALQTLKRRSAVLGTELVIQGDIGAVTLK